ncbi:hypothetical protein [Pseudoalteromonas sp. R3]|uniref:hypothetical protein n=1 Tax=Pseudoalteromonas sp. R3 TaxID=1709477 RepID=UPI0006B446F4|nr:hypothetical protein [Pseudoalteromonas sp. R3]AZZ95850.1 amino acid ABC transporter substrate-binding protein [Pseudoalteromonas sp. R3]
MRFILISLLFLFACNQVSAKVSVRLCYEDKHIPPFFLGNGLDVPRENPGATIEILRLLETRVGGVQFEFVRKPWQRCLYEIKRNRVDAVIASYRSARESFLSYPLNEDGSPNTLSSISRLGTCLVGMAQLKTAMSTEHYPINLAVPRGYSVADSVGSDRYTILNTDSQSDAFELVLKGKVHGTFGLCQVDGKAVSAFPYRRQLEAVYPPLDISFGYLTFSKQFRELHSETALALWSSLTTTELHHIYIAYINRQSYPGDTLDSSEVPSQPLWHVFE